MTKKTLMRPDSFLSPYFSDPFIHALFSLIDIFFPPGEVILSHMLRCSSFEVDDHVFMSRRLASAAISTREQHKLNSNKKCLFQ
jgi:hypothetical protein